MAGVPLWAAVELGSLPSPPQAAIMVLTSPAAPPVSAARRVNAAQRVCGVSSCFESSHSRRSTASWTGSSCDILALLLFGAEARVPHSERFVRRVL